MIIISNSEDLKVLPGENVTFDICLFVTGRHAEDHRTGTSSIRMTNRGLYEISFNANIEGGAPDSPADLVIMRDNDELNETHMLSSIPNFQNVSALTSVCNSRCNSYNSITVKNTGENALTVKAGSKFSVRRIG